MECGECGHQTSVIAGTIFQDTRKPLTDWFRAMYWVRTQKNGGLHEGESHRIFFSEPFPPNIEGLLANPAILAKSSHR